MPVNFDYEEFYNEFLAYTTGQSPTGSFTSAINFKSDFPLSTSYEDLMDMNILPLSFCTPEKMSDCVNVVSNDLNGIDLSRVVQNVHKKKDVEKLQKRKLVRCQCPNCSVAGDKKTKSPDGKLQHLCNFSGCGQLFGYPHTLRRHLLVHNGVKAYNCPYCNKEFSRKDKLADHYKRHTHALEEKEVKIIRYVCDVAWCRKNFSNAGNLKRHLAGHNDIKNFVCEHCSNRFRRKEHLKKHLKVHKNLIKDLNEF